MSNVTLIDNYDSFTFNLSIILDNSAQCNRAS